MVKVKLIEHSNYYKIKSKQVVLGSFFPGIFFIIIHLLIILEILVGFRIPSFWYPIMVFIFIIISSVFIFRNKKKLDQLVKKTLEIDNTEIRLKSSKGQLLESIQLEAADKIIVKEEYYIPQKTTFKQIKDEMAGKHNMHYFTLIQNGTERRFDFEIDSEYKLKQLKSTIESWKESNLKIEITAA